MVGAFFYVAEAQELRRTSQLRYGEIHCAKVIVRGCEPRKGFLCLSPNPPETCCPRE